MPRGASAVGAGHTSFFSDMITKGYISVIASKIRISKENFMPKKEF